MVEDVVVKKFTFAVSSPDEFLVQFFLTSCVFLEQYSELDWVLQKETFGNNWCRFLIRQFIIAPKKYQLSSICTLQ